MKLVFDRLWNFFPGLALLLVSFLAFGGTAFSATTEDWVFVGPERPPEMLNAVAGDGNGVFVAVGDNGVVHWSPDGEQWVFLPIRGLHGDVMDVQYLRDEWILVSNTGEVGVSQNGRVWDIQSVGGAFKKIVEFQGRTCLVADWGIATSDDNRSWSLKYKTFGELVDAVVVDGKLVVVSYQHNGMTSLNLLGTVRVDSTIDTDDWQRTEFDVDVRGLEKISLAAIDGLAVVTTNETRLYTSTDYLTWEVLDDPSGKNATLENAFVWNGRIVMFARLYKFINGEFVVTEDGTYVSVGEDVVFRDEEDMSPMLRDAFVFNGVPDGSVAISMPVHVADGRGFVLSDLGSLYNSSDLNDWNLRFSGIDDDFVSIASGEDSVVAVSESGAVLSSENGISWTPILKIDRANAHEVIYSDGVYWINSGQFESFTVRFNTYGRNRYSLLSYSYDGLDWKTTGIGPERVVDGVSQGNKFVYYDAFVYTGELALAVSRGGDVYRSENLEDWEILSGFPSVGTSTVRAGMVLHYYEGEYWTRSIEYLSNAIRPSLFSCWYQSTDNGESWSFVSETPPEFIDLSEYSQWPYAEGGLFGNEFSTDHWNTEVYTFGRNIRVGEDFRVELSAVENDSARTRLVNLSARAYAGTGDATLIAGLVTSVNEEDVALGGPEVLLRGVGPSLVLLDSNLSDELAKDPQLTLYRGLEVEATNDDYEAGTNVSFAQTGAFDLEESGKDAALTGIVGAGLFSAHVTDSEGGIALAEVYRIPNVGIELENLSARAVVSGGNRTLIGGFVLEGESVRTILIRGVGPGLDLEGVLADPAINLYRGAELIASNDDWGGNVFFKDFFEKAGAFELDDDSADAALVLPLGPGAYTVHLVSKEGDELYFLMQLGSSCDGVS